MADREESRATIARLRASLGDRAMISDGCLIAPDVQIDVAAGGFLSLADGVLIGRGTSIGVSRDATAVFGPDVHIGENVYVYIMCGLRMGAGSALSNMVDIHDHNHRVRRFENLGSGRWHPSDTGFEAAPILIDEGAIISNKVSVVAGCHVGFNTLVGANSVVTRSIPPNAVAVGAPATVSKRFPGPRPAGYRPRTLSIGFFGTSIMLHPEAYAPTLVNPWELAPVGSVVTVESHRPAGWTRRLHTQLRRRFPHVAWTADNRASGGATTRDMLAALRGARDEGRHYDVIYLGAGLNDVWRHFQGRHAEAVDLDEYAGNVEECLRVAAQVSQHQVYVGETPFGLPDEATEAMNARLRDHLAAARRICSDAGVTYVDCYTPFAETAGLAGGDDGGGTPWSDGVHLSDLGDEIVVDAVFDAGMRDNLFTTLQNWPLHPRDEALQRYAGLTAAWRDLATRSTAVPAAPRSSRL